jgi:hypothetical protein
VLNKLGLHSGAAKAAVDTIIWTKGADSMRIERIVQLFTNLNGKGEVREALQGSVQQLQRFVGTEKPVLETKLQACTCEKRCTWRQKKKCKTSVGWDGSWVGMVWETLSETGISIVGGLGLPKLRQHDACLVDLAVNWSYEDREMLRAGCMEAEMWRISEVTKLNGLETREALRIGGSMESVVSKDWADAARGLADNYIRAMCDIGLEGLGRWERDKIHSWQVGAWAGRERTELGLIRGEVVDGRIKVLRLTRAEGVEATEVRKTLRGRGRVRGTIAAAVWRHELDDNTETVWVSEEELWPVEWIRTEGPKSIEGEETGRTVWYVLDDIPEGLAQDLAQNQSESGCDKYRHEWMQKEGFVPGTETDREGMRDILKEADGGEGGWSTRTMQTLFGEGKLGMQGSAKYDEAHQRCLEQGLSDDEWPSLDMFSDGGADGASTKTAVAQYGWAVSAEGEQLDVIAEGGGPVRGLAEDMDSNRAELYGAIAVIKRTEAWRGSKRLWIDNDNVVRGLQMMLKGADKDQDAWTAAQTIRGKKDEACSYTGERKWLRKAEDRDLWEVLELLVMDLEGTLTVHWQRGHQDKQAKYRELTKAEKGNIWADKICNKMKGIVQIPDRLHLPRKRSWRVCWNGVEMVGKIDKELAEKIGIEKILGHWEVQRGWGGRAREWIGEEAARRWMKMSGSITVKTTRVKCMWSMWQTEDVIASRMAKLSDEERKEASKCKLCKRVTMSECRNWHLLAECKGCKQNEARRAVLQAVDRALEKLKIHPSLRELIRLPWALDKKHCLLDFENLNQITQRAPVQHKDKVAVLRAVVRAGAVEGKTELKRAMEARQMVYKGMVGAEWDRMVRSFGVDEETTTKLRWKLQAICADSVNGIWKAYVGALKMVARAKAVKENPGFGETLEAAGANGKVRRGCEIENMRLS